MALLKKAKQHEMPFLKALAHAQTGDIIVISPAPDGFETGTHFAHMQGILSLIDGNVYLNNTFVCSNDVRETHGNFYPFYDRILIRRSHGNVNEFYWMRPSDPKSASKNTKIIPKPAFTFEAESLKVVPLSSGKGLILIESGLKQRILLLKKLNLLGTKWNKITAKDVSVAWDGSHDLYVPTPSSVVVGVKISVEGGSPITRFYRGHGRHLTPIHDHPGVVPLSMWATDLDFFYEANLHGQDTIISATTGKAIYPSTNLDLYATSQALVRYEDTTVEANGVLITDSFNAKMVIPNPNGLFYFWHDELRMLVIKDVPEKQR